MNIQAKGLPVTRLKTKFNKKAGDTILYYDEKSVGKPNFPDEIDLRKLTGGGSSSFRIIPSSDERDVVYICGKAGSVKHTTLNATFKNIKRSILKILFG
jgi:hypothetical protein